MMMSEVDGRDRVCVCSSRLRRGEAVPHRCVADGGCTLRNRLGSALPRSHRDASKGDGGALLHIIWGVEPDVCRRLKCEGPEKRGAFLKAAQPGGLACGEWGGWVRVGAPRVFAQERPCNAASSGC